MEESTTYQAILAKGEARGETQGRTTEARRIVRLLGERRFGFPDQASELTLNTITDRERLERIAARLLDAADWPDLLATP